MTFMAALSGIKVEKSSCTVAFRVWTKYGDKDLCNDGVEITHGMLYQMLESAECVTDRNDDKYLSENGRIAHLDMGGNVTVDVWVIVR